MFLLKREVFWFLKFDNECNFSFPFSLSYEYFRAARGVYLLPCVMHSWLATNSRSSTCRPGKFTFYQCRQWSISCLGIWRMYVLAIANCLWIRTRLNRINLRFCTIRKIQERLLSLLSSVFRCGEVCKFLVAVDGIKILIHWEALCCNLVQFKVLDKLWL